MFCTIFGLFFVVVFSCELEVIFRGVAQIFPEVRTIIHDNPFKHYFHFLTSQQQKYSLQLYLQYYKIEKKNRQLSLN